MCQGKVLAYIVVHAVPGAVLCSCTFFSTATVCCHKPQIGMYEHYNFDMLSFLVR